MIDQKVQEFLTKKLEFGKNSSFSAIQNLLKTKLIHCDSEEVRFEIEVKEYMLNPAGSIHGGYLSLILDEFLGARVFFMGRPEIFVALNLNVDFLKAAFLGEKLTISPKIVRNGRKIVHAECHIFNANGELIAKGASNFTPIKTA